MRQLEVRVRELAKQYVDRMRDDFGGQCDFVADISLHFPL